MLNGREALKKELRFKSIVMSASGAYDPAHLDNSFHVPMKVARGDVGELEVPPSVWMNTKAGNTTESLGVAQIQVNRKVMVSDI